MIELKQGDCLELMKNIPDKSIDLILCDLPYGLTSCEWDKPIPLKPLWEQYNRVIKDNGAIILFAKDKLSAELIMSNEENYRYKWIWNKKLSGSFHNAKYQPLQIVEEILIFSKNRINYFPIMRHGKMRKRGGAKNLNSTMNGGFKKGYENYSDLYFPTNVLEFARLRTDKLHPTQKPIKLLEYLILTYTRENDIVLDNCMGSGSTGVACINNNRNFIGIELDDKYFDIAKERIMEASDGKID